jgi:hypothetical protein
MSLVSIVEALQKRPLTTEETGTLNEFQQFFKIDDEDPLMVVLALMARSQLIVETVPGLLQQKVDATIELHRMALREQAVLVAKELVSSVASELQMVGKNKTVWWQYAGFFFSGVVCVVGAIGWIKYLWR